MIEMKYSVNVKRVYEDPSGAPGDGFRVFVDRLWPRGESKLEFHYDFWAKGVAPSTELREWYHADPESRWEEFEAKYLEELRGNPEVSSLLELLRGHEVITLLYGSRDVAHNNAVVLAGYLRNALNKGA